MSSENENPQNCGILPISMLEGPSTEVLEQQHTAVNQEIINFINQIFPDQAKAQLPQQILHLAQYSFDRLTKYIPHCSVPAEHKLHVAKAIVRALLLMQTQTLQSMLEEQKKWTAQAVQIVSHHPSINPSSETPIQQQILLQIDQQIYERARLTTLQSYFEKIRPRLCFKGIESKQEALEDQLHRAYPDILPSFSHIEAFLNNNFTFIDNELHQPHHA